MTSGYYLRASNGRNTANSGPPKQKSVYLITYSHCDSSQLSRAEFANIIVDTWHSRSRSRITQWAVSLEAHQDGGNHFHMAIKLSSTSRWQAIRKLVDNKYGMKLNFSNKHENYYTAHEYVVKEDPDFILSAGHPDLSNATPPRSTNAKKLVRTRNFQLLTLFASYRTKRYRLGWNTWHWRLNGKKREKQTLQSSCETGDRKQLVKRSKLLKS